MSRICQLKYARDAKRFAERCGYANVSVGYLRKHPVLRGVVNGKPVSMLIPGTPGDQRGRQNLYAGLRWLAREARLSANEGWVSVGITSDTAEFAVASIKT